MLTQRENGIEANYSCIRTGHGLAGAGEASRLCVGRTAMESCLGGRQRKGVHKRRCASPRATEQDTSSHLVCAHHLVQREEEALHLAVHPNMRRRGVHAAWPAMLANEPCCRPKVATKVVAGHMPSHAVFGNSYKVCRISKAGPQTEHQGLGRRAEPATGRSLGRHDEAREPQQHERLREGADQPWRQALKNAVAKVSRRRNLVAGNDRRAFLYDRPLHRLGNF
mmetsp:Transcript_8696/g.27807  ORF Transcript_8696/g.27807 Transcript_8696/m.27807 type:complete len:224 (-) Transcript_8696:489-1160(-)